MLQFLDKEAKELLPRAIEFASIKWGEPKDDVSPFVCLYMCTACAIREYKQQFKKMPDFDDFMRYTEADVKNLSDVEERIFKMFFFTAQAILSKTESKADYLEEISMVHNLDKPNIMRI